MIRYPLLAQIAIAAIVAVVTLGGTTPLVAAETPAATAPSTQPDQAGAVNRFYGTVTAVDTKAMTLTIDNQVYHVIAETHITKASDDQAATLTDAVVGEPARGTFTKAADGTLNATKVRFGKKTGGKGGGKKKNDAPASQPHNS